MTVMAIDYGDRRVGVAVTDELEMIASPLETVENDDQLVAHLSEIIRTRKVDTVVIGLPLNMNGSKGPAAEKSLAFAERLQAETDATVETFDERLTSAQADRALLRHDVSRSKRARRVDEMAAQFILQSYLDAKESRKRRGPG